MLHEIKSKIYSIQICSSSWLSKTESFGMRTETLFRTVNKTERSYLQSQQEAKTIIHNNYTSGWKNNTGMDNQTCINPSFDQCKQTIIFHLRTGHCRLLGHPYSIKDFHSKEFNLKLEFRMNTSLRTAQLKRSTLSVQSSSIRYGA